MGNFFAIAFIIGLVVIGGSLFYFMTTFTKGRSFEDYAKEYPGHIQNGKVKCYKCGANAVFVRRVGNSLTAILNSHVCRHCGTELYRSETPL